MMNKSEIDKLILEIIKLKPKIVAIQIPEGLKKDVSEISGRIEKECGCTAVVFADPCFGACDLADENAAAIGAELLVHFGHEKIYSGKVKTIFVPLYYEVDKEKLKELIDALDFKKEEKICLCAVTQYLPYLGEVEKSLKAKSIEVFVGEGDKRIAKNGQILGCNYSSVKAVLDKCDKVLFIGDGEFHSLGISYITEKPVFVLNPLENEVKKIEGEKERFFRKRFGVIAASKDAEDFLIAVSTKKGQQRMELALNLKRMIEKKGKRAQIVASDLIREQYFLGFKYDAIISTACPRISADDYASFKKPVLSPIEAEILFGKRKPEEFEFDEF